MIQKINYFFILLLLSSFGCGIKGDPRPPQKPPFIGKGEPSFRGALVEEKKSEDEELKKKEKQK